MTFNRPPEPTDEVRDTVERILTSQGSTDHPYYNEAGDVIILNGTTITRVADETHGVYIETIETSGDWEEVEA